MRNNIHQQECDAIEDYLLCNTYYVFIMLPSFHNVYMVKKFKLFQQCILTPLQADKQYLKICSNLSKIRLI